VAHGPTTARELGDAIENEIRSERQALDLVTALEASAIDYVALLAPREHPRFLTKYGHDARDALYTITRELRSEQILPLLLAVIRKFSSAEAEKAFELFIAWIVRFLIVGTGGGGVLDRHYGLRAMEIQQGAGEDHQRTGPEDGRGRAERVHFLWPQFGEATSLDTICARWTRF
jgi:hypothetical protein